MNVYLKIEFPFPELSVTVLECMSKLYLVPVARAYFEVMVSVFPFTVVVTGFCLPSALSSTEPVPDLIFSLKLTFMVTFFDFSLNIILLFAGLTAVTFGFALSVVTLVAEAKFTFKTSANPNSRSTDKNNFRLIIPPPCPVLPNKF